MKILLISPSKMIQGDGSDEGSLSSMMHKGFLMEPLNLEFIGAMLKDHDVELLDMVIEPNLAEKLGSFKPDIVGVSCVAIQGVNNARKVLQTIKEFNPETITVAGGSSVAFLPEEFDNSNVDFHVIGEGEYTMRELVEALESGGDFRKIKGLAYRENGTLCFTEKRPPVEDLDALPFPARHLTRKYFSHYRHHQAQIPLGSVFTSRGCPNRCIFCTVAEYFGRKLRCHSPERVVEEILLLKSMGINAISLVDDNFLQHVKRVDTIVSLLTQKNIQLEHINMSARADCIVRAGDVLAKLKTVSDDISICVGFEGISDEWLKTLKKGTTRKINDNAIAILKDLDIPIAGGFVINPDAEVRDFRELAEYVEEKDFSIVTFTPLIPLPGTAAYAMHSYVTRDWDQFDGRHLVVKTKLPVEQFTREWENLENLATKLMFKHRKAQNVLNNEDRDTLHKILSLKK
ncbi:MAG: cobalamin-dependent protein [Spirochaetales bacterium]|nr:cobalamin-dependent protein [Spirochaetales bacterium]